MYIQNIHMHVHKNTCAHKFITTEYLKLRTCTYMKNKRSVSYYINLLMRKTARYFVYEMSSHSVSKVVGKSNIEMSPLVFAPHNKPKNTASLGKYPIQNYLVYKNNKLNLHAYIHKQIHVNDLELHTYITVIMYTLLWLKFPESKLFKPLASDYLPKKHA